MQGTAEKRYSQLEGAREAYLRRARDCAKLTIPSLIPESDDQSGNRFRTPQQSLGSRGVNNLSAKLLLALFPPNTSFFRFVPDQAVLEEMSQDPGVKTEVERALGKLERQAQARIESMGTRIQMFEALKHLIVGGNALVYQGATGIKVFHLRQYVTKRDPSGKVLEIVVKEGVDPAALDDAVLALLEPGQQRDTAGNSKKNLHLYTHVKLVGEKYTVYQEINGKPIPGSNGAYPVDKTPWIALRFIKVEGEDYGRGYIEEYYGDLNSLEKLTKAIVEGSAAAAKILFLVNPNGTTRARTLEKAPNGAIREGNAADITVLQLQKAADFRVALETIHNIEKRLEHAFLLNSSVQRNGERVTAEEIRYMAGELEDALGGIYSLMSLELQLPFVNRLIHVMEKERKFPQMPKGLVHPTIVTGMEALGRGHDLQKLDLFVRGMAEALGPEALAQFMNIGDYIKRRATALGIDTEGLIKTEEQLQAEQQQAEQQQQMMQMQQMAEKLGPSAIGMAGKAMQAQGDT